MKILQAAQWLFQSMFGNSQQKYESRYFILAALAHASNLKMYNKNLLWLNDPEFKHVWQNYKSGRARVHERKFNLYYIAKSLQHIPGDIVECGVFDGSSGHIMLAALPDRHYHGFDSFDGLSEPDGADIPNDSHTFKWKKHDLKIDENYTIKCLAHHEGRFTLYKGWIPDRFMEINNKRFSIVHIDVDLYKPTLDSLKFFYPLLNAGGIVVCDDYGSEACPGAFKAMNEYAELVGTSVIHLTTGQGLIIKPGS